MQIERTSCLLVLAAGFYAATAQSTLPNSLEPGQTLAFHAPKVVESRKSARKAKHRKIKAKHSARYEFYDRVEKAAREKKRILKKLGTPQFSDPRYFGHKRIPKRKPSYKMRYCDECGIRH